ncbi:unnamed protein product [Prorocentrum cordatum]|uniref:Uncharacterized protein n=1 Tax=Prorocentrum cordatum TaxID=2364126 RepID=A0ABN9UJY1_9DINO|nr:unnamed protein product [Polarella glacialis]|mmetsp:Transcript_104111/g.275272  ORF Transcript_104111/g.275272 Transcript_104111/m.275272 type:complete len:317 (+) Transcript_104111:93-1043(+)
MSGTDMELAWGLTVTASLSTLAGAAIAMAREPVALSMGAGLRSLGVAAALALAAGVMLFVAVAELFGKSEEYFLEGGQDENHAKLSAALSFFGGACLVLLANEVSVWISPEHGNFELTPKPPPVAAGAAAGGDDGDAAPQAPCRAADAVYYRLGVQTVAAIALHNFPEGLAAFLATMADGRSGLGIAFGVILHNVPEGLCVAAPIYLSTRSRAKALGWAAVAGAAELLGGCTGWLLARGKGSAEVDGVVFGALFGMVNGIVVVISALEFLPKALQIERNAAAHAVLTGGKPRTNVVSTMFVAGMALIALTLIVEAY